MASQRQMQDLGLPLALNAALHQNEDILDGLADREVLLNHEYPRHRLTLLDPLVGKVAHGPDIVGQELTIIKRGSFEDDLVRSTPKANVLDPNEIEIWPVIPQATRDVAVEVLIGQETKHSY